MMTSELITPDGDIIESEAAHGKLCLDFLATITNASRLSVTKAPSLVTSANIKRATKRARTRLLPSLHGPGVSLSVLN